MIKGAKKQVKIIQSVRVLGETAGLYQNGMVVSSGDNVSDARQTKSPKTEKQK